MKFTITKPIRLIELFAGIGSQAMALRDIGADFEHYRVVEFDKYPVASYNAIHGTNFSTMDITKITGNDLGIVDTDLYTYLLTLFLVRICPWQVKVRVWQKVKVHGLVYSGRLRDCLMKQRTFLKSL